MKYIIGMFVVCAILWMTTSTLYIHNYINYEWKQTLFTFITVSFIVFFGRKVGNWRD